MGKFHFENEETKAALKNIGIVLVLLAVALLLNSISPKSKPTPLSNGPIQHVPPKNKPTPLSDDPIQYVLFNDDGSLLITKVRDQTEPDYWNTSTGLIASGPPKPLGQYELLKSGFEKGLIVCSNDSMREIYDVVGNRRLGKYRPEIGVGYSPKMVSPQKGYILEWFHADLRERELIQRNYEKYGSRSNWVGGNRFDIFLYSLKSGKYLKSFNVYHLADISTDGRFIAPVTFSDDDQWLAITRTGWHSKSSPKPSRATIYDLKDLYIVKEVTVSLSTNDIKISPNKKFIAEFNRDSGWYGVRSLLYDQENKITPPKKTRRLYFVNDQSALCVTTKRIYLLNCLSGESDVVADSLQVEEAAFAGNKLACLKGKNKITLMDASTFKVIWQFQSDAFGDDRDTSFLGVAAKIIRTGSNSMKRTCDTSFHCALSADARYLAVWNFHHAALWNTEEKKLIGYLSKEPSDPQTIRTRLY